MHEKRSVLRPSRFLIKLSVSYKLRMNASCMKHVCIMNVSKMYHVFNFLTETIDKRQRMSINSFEK